MLEVLLKWFKNTMTICEQIIMSIEPAYAGRQASAIFRSITMAMNFKMSFVNNHKPSLSI